MSTDPYASEEESAAVLRPATENEKWLHGQLDRIDPHRLDMGSAGEVPALVKLVFELRQRVKAIETQQDGETIVQTFTGLPKRKLIDLLEAGWQINGVCFQRTEENGTVRRGAITTGGMVLWWSAEQPAQPLTMQPDPVATLHPELYRQAWNAKHPDMAVAEQPAQPHQGNKASAHTILDEVLSEVKRATQKFPTWPSDPLHALAVLGEEFGELTKDMLQLVYEPHKTTREDARAEAIQTAAMALRFLASFDAYEFRQSQQHEQAYPLENATTQSQNHGDN